MMKRPSSETFGPIVPPCGASRPVGRPLLVMAHIRGDLEALDSVLSAVRSIELCGIAAAGEHCFAGPDPFGVWRRLHELSAHLALGETDLALALQHAHGTEPIEGLADYTRTKEALGELVCRRLGNLPSTQVVSLDTRAGVMIRATPPGADGVALHPRMPPDEMNVLLGYAAEEVLVVAKGTGPFARQCGNVLVVHPGRVSPDAGHEDCAAAMLITGYSDGMVRAQPLRVPIARAARKAG